jgi:hypothetical protein
MKDEFKITDLRLMKDFLGIEVFHSKDGIFSSQSKYAHENMKIFNMINSNEAPTPVITWFEFNKEYEGSKVDPTLFKRVTCTLMYLTTRRPNIMYGVSLISRFMETPKESHIFCHYVFYFKIFQTYRIQWKWFWRKHRWHKKYLWVHISFWNRASRKQPIVTISSIEDEYVVAIGIACQAIWMRRMLKYFL